MEIAAIPGFRLNSWGSSTFPYYRATGVMDGQAVEFTYQRGVAKLEIEGTKVKIRKTYSSPDFEPQDDGDYQTHLDFTEFSTLLEVMVPELRTRSAEIMSVNGIVEIKDFLGEVSAYGVELSEERHDGCACSSGMRMDIGPVSTRRYLTNWAHRRWMEEHGDYADLDD
jgi:hypothetical protein